MNCPYLSSNIPESPAYAVLVSQLIRFAQVCSKYEDFLFRGSILVSKILKQGCSLRKLQTTFRNFYGRHTDLVHKFDKSVSHMLNGLFTNCDIWLVSIFWVINRDGCHMWGITCSAGTPDSLPLRSSWFTHSLYIYITYYWIVSFRIMFTD